MEDVTMTQNMMALVTDAYLALIGEWSQDQDQDLDSRLKDQIRSDLDLTKEEREE